MAGIQSSSAGYATNASDEKETGTGFEFTRRKKWPSILLQELVGAALFCLKPYQLQRSNMDGSGRSNNSLGWKIIYISPSSGEMIGQKTSELENRDFLDLVYPADQPSLQSLFLSLINPPLTGNDNSGSSSNSSNAGQAGQVGAGKSQTTYARISSSDSGGDSSRSGPVAWELRAHATGLDVLPSSFAGAGGYRLDGTVIPRGSGDEGALKGKAVWVMGRKIGSGNADDVQSLDAFLELKLENEKLREELRELHNEIEDENYDGSRSYLNPISLDIPSPTSSSSSPASPSSSSSSASIREKKEKKKASRPSIPKDKEREKKRPKKSAAAGGMGAGSALSTLANTAAASGASGSGNKGEGEGLHVCVTCGRTDSPEWRKGPLGPKTLCNACGLRWAKRNSTAPSRKERKAAEAASQNKKA